MLLTSYCASCLLFTRDVSTEPVFPAMKAEHFGPRGTPQLIPSVEADGNRMQFSEKSMPKNSLAPPLRPFGNPGSATALGSPIPSHVFAKQPTTSHGINSMDLFLCRKYFVKTQVKIKLNVQVFVYCLVL